MNKLSIITSFAGLWLTSYLSDTNQIIFGFAAETSEDLELLEENGRAKLASKSLDLIYVNNVSNGAVFGSDFTQGLIIDRNMNVIKVPEISKDTLSDILLDQLVSKLG